MYNRGMNIQRLARVLREECLLDLQKPVIVAVSGGPDSLCLLDLLYLLEYPLLVAHYDHSLRPESAEDARQVAMIAAGHHLPFLSERGDVMGLAKRERLSVEEAARVARYRFLFEQARQHQAQAVAVGHNADDQVETVLMHLLRGAGMAGLKGMTYRSFLTEWDTQIPLVRPLLGVWRTEIMAYCEERGLKPVNDRSNQDLTFFRNRLRHELVPFLEQYNPQVKNVVWRMANNLAADYGFLEQSAHHAWKNCLAGEGQGYVALVLSLLIQLPLAQQRSVLRRALAELRPMLRDIDFSAVERALEFIKNPPRRRQMNLVRHLNLLIDGELLFIRDDAQSPQIAVWPQLGSEEKLILKVPGETVLQNGWILDAQMERVGKVVGDLFLEDHPYKAHLDRSTLEFPLYLRTRREGDRIQPLGMEGHSLKLADFMTNIHLPRMARNRWPLVCSGDRVAWLPGYRLAHFCRVRSETRDVIVLELKKISANNQEG